MLIDVNASFGGREGVQQFSVETMLDQLNRTPCDVAFVHCQQGMTDSASANEQTFALCARHSWLRPCGVIHPRNTFTWREELDRCLAAGTRLFRIYPDQGAWPVDSVLLDQIVDQLGGTGAVLMVEATTPGLPSRIAERTVGDDLPVIFTEARYFPLTELLPLVKRYPNLYIETSRLTSPHGIEHCVEMVGAHRLVYGSGAGRYPAWVAWQTLERAAISAEERAAIAGGNAAALLGVTASERHVRVPTIPAPPPTIDVHLHDKFPGAPFRPFSPEEYAAELDRQGIIGGVCSSITGIFYDLQQGNDEVAALLAAVPKLRGYVVVDPRFPEESATQLRRLDGDTGFAGVKIHCSYSRTPTNSPAMRRLFDLIAPYEKPVLIHNLGPDWPEALVEIAQAHPRLPIIAAHAGYGDGPLPTHDAALRLVPAPNIYLEFCSTYLATGAIRRGIDAVSAERVLFGSDFPLISLGYMRAAYEDAELSPEEAALIYIENAQRLFPGIGAHAPAPVGQGRSVNQ
ncbi:MAG TPA: amidohydrolase family protein [Thermomicrobiales bacterium]|nr:amidohydrolase family protein [Thermomicrobiales bacterium]